MNNLFKKDRSIFFLLSILSVLLFSCEYETQVRDAEYPDQLIYMPAAANNNGIFVINDITRKIGELPIEGSPYRYVVNVEDRQFVIPLSVYRSGVNNKGGFNVDIAVDTDTISKLIANGNLADTILVLPQDKYSIDDFVNIPDGEEIGKFNLKIDFDFLLNNYPHNVYALGINISSTERETNPKLSTTIIVIDTKIMKSTPDFSFSVDEDDPSLVTFENKSLMALSYKWDFGDGTTSTEESPGTHRYPTSVFDEFYTITLTTVGIDGNENVLTKSSEEAAPPKWKVGDVIANGLIAPGWIDRSWRVDRNFENMDSGELAIKLNCTQEWGYLFLRTADENGIDISNFTELAIWIKASEGLGNYPTQAKLFIKNKNDGGAEGVEPPQVLYMNDIPKNEFKEYVFKNLGGRKTVTEFYLKNMGFLPNGYYVKRVEFR